MQVTTYLYCYPVYGFFPKKVFTDFKWRLLTEVAVVISGVNNNSHAI